MPAVVVTVEFLAAAAIADKVAAAGSIFAHSAAIGSPARTEGKFEQQMEENRICLCDSRRRRKIRLGFANGRLESIKVYEDL
jgi:hypothetical protein